MSRKPEDVRQALIAESLALLAEKGTAELSLREIAKRVGVSHPAAYHHFENKGALLAAVAAHGFDRLDAAMADAAAGVAEDDPVGRVVALGQAYVRFALAHPDLFRLMFRREALGTDAALVIATAEKSFARVQAAVEAACARASDPPDPHATTTMAWAAMHGLATLWNDGPLAVWSGEQSVEPIVQRVGFVIGRLLV